MVRLFYLSVVSFVGFFCWFSVTPYEILPVDSSGGGGALVSFSFVYPEEPVVFSREQIEEIILNLSSQYGADSNIISKIVQVESNFDPNARSPKGALGLMQLMPLTAKSLGVKDPFCPYDNISGGISYYLYLYNYFGNVELALAAYNAGIGNVKKYGGIPPFPETISYVQAVLN